MLPFDPSTEQETGYQCTILILRIKVYLRKSLISVPLLMLYSLPRMSLLSSLPTKIPFYKVQVNLQRHPKFPCWKQPLSLWYSHGILSGAVHTFLKGDQLTSLEVAAGKAAQCIHLCTHYSVCSTVPWISADQESMASMLCCVT